MLKFDRSYFILTIVLLIVEVLIALFVTDSIIRPYVGDFLVVMLLYCFVRSFLHVHVIKTAIGVLLFAYLIEVLQYFKLVERLGLQNSPIARTIIGNSFEWIDMVAYTLGILCVIIIERGLRGKLVSA